MGENLTAKQAKFVQLYLANGRKGADAYRRAYNAKASPQRAAEEASKLLRHLKIAPLVAEAERKASKAIEAAADRYAVSRERNLAELARMAYANIADYTKLIDGERVVDLTAATRDELAAVQEIIVEDFRDGRGEDARDVRRVRFKLADKQGALERINRMMGWMIDRSEVGKPGDFASLTDEALEQDIIDRLVARGLTLRQAREVLRAKQEAATTQ